MSTCALTFASYNGLNMKRIEERSSYIYCLPTQKLFCHRDTPQLKPSEKTWQPHTVPREEHMLDQAFFEIESKKLSTQTILLEFIHQLALAVTVKQEIRIGIVPALAAYQHISINRHILTGQIIIFLHLQHRQSNFVLECPYFRLVVLQHSDFDYHGTRIQLADSKHTIHLKHICNITSYGRLHMLG